VPWWVTVLIYIGLTLVYELIRPKPEFDSPEPAGMSDFKFPTIGEGRPLPIVWGTVIQRGPMVVWWGDLDVEARKKWVKTGLFSGEHVTTHYRYYLGVQLVLCSGEIDEVVEVRFDDRPIPSTITTPQSYRTSVWIDAMSFFGGEETGEEGGVRGRIWIYHGTAEQPRNSYLEDHLGEDVSAYRHVCYAVMQGANDEQGMYLGTSPYIKDVAFVLRRCPNSLGLTGGDENIDGDANPAAMIYELMTRPPGQNGLGIPAGFIDVDAFRAVGAQLADDEHGLSMMQERSTPAKDLILEVLRHIDGIIYVEPSTGLLTLTLVRFDYVEDDLDTFDETNCTVTGFSRASWGEIKNQIRVAYVDRADGFVEKTVQAQDRAAIEVAGGEVSTQDLKYRGFSNATIAQLWAARALSSLAYPLAAIEMQTDRSAWSLRPGAVFKLDWPKLGVEGMVCRVLRIGTGDLLSGMISIEAVEDVFAVDWTAYTPPGSSDWPDPVGNVPELTDQAAINAPYEACKGLAAPEGSAHAIVLAARGVPGVSKGFRPLIDSTGDPIPYFTPSGTLDDDIDESTTSFDITIGPDCGQVLSVNDPDYDAGFNVLWIDGGTGPTQTGLEEFIAFKTISVVDDTMTISVLARGCLDTAPTAFSEGARVWILSYANTVIPVDTAGEVITFQPYNNNGVLALGSCDDSTISGMNPDRADRVYCPTDARFNGDSYPSSISGELTVSWEHRDRFGEWVYSESGETSAPEDDTEYDVLVYGESDTLIHTEPGITGKSWTYLEADEIADSGLGRLNNHLRVIIRTYGDSRAHQAFREIEWEFDRV